MKTKVREQLNSYLLKNTPSKDLTENIEFLTKEIPSIKKMIDFPQNPPHHHLDVWKHTLLALDNSEKDLEIRMALLFHDIGKPVCYVDDEEKIRHFKGHEKESAYLAYINLKRLGYPQEFIDNIIYLVRLHDTAIEIEEVTKDSLPLEIKRLKIQYADALAHHPKKVEERVKVLNEITENLCDKCLKKNKERTRK